MQLKVTPRLEERINQRWLHWHPWMLMLARKRLPFVALDLSLDAARKLHRERYLDALLHRLTDQRIRLSCVDDPRLHQDEYRVKLENILRRQVGQRTRKVGVRRTRRQILQQEQERLHAHVE